ncbi:hypothetical protein RUND412_009591 [Rhizina undulata]
MFQSLSAEILELILVQLIEELEREAGVEHFGDEFAPQQSGHWRVKRRELKWILSATKKGHKMAITSIGPNTVLDDPWLTGYSQAPAEATETVNVVQGTYRTQRLRENEYLDIIETCPNLEFLELQWIMIAHLITFSWLEKVVQLE